MAAASEALAEAFAYTEDPQALQAAIAAADWVLEQRALEGGGFAHGATPGGPYLADSLACGKAFLALYGVTAERRWLESARQTGHFLLRAFATPEGFVSARGPLGVRQREENVEALRFLVRLAEHCGEPALREGAEPAWRMLSHPELARRYNTACVLLAERTWRGSAPQVVVTGSKRSPEAAALFAAARRFPDRNKRVEWLDPAEGPLPNPDSAYPVGARPAAYVCVEGRCTRVEDPQALSHALQP